MDANPWFLIYGFESTDLKKALLCRFIRM